MEDKVIKRKVLQLGEALKDGRRYRASLELELRSCDNARDVDLNELRTYTREFSVCGTIDEFDRRWRDYSGGQNVDEVAALFPDNALVQEIRVLWERWHLNCLTAGTRTQETYLRAYRKYNPEWRYDYTEACEILKRAGLYEDRGYKYGHAWLAEPIPAEIEVRIREIME